MKPPFLGKNQSMLANPHAGTVSGPFKQSVEAFIFTRSEKRRPPGALYGPPCPWGRRSQGGVEMQAPL